MGDVPTTDNKAADIVNQFIDTLMNLGTKAAETYLVSLAPEMLGIPIVNALVDQGVEFVAGILDHMIKKMATSLVIDFQTKGEKSDVMTAMVALQFAISSGDPNAVEAAKQEAINKWGRLIHYDGSSPT